MATNPVGRARAAFLGLALGDAYGRPLEFVHLPEVRRSPVSFAPGVFRWTDDTHMALYLGRALLDVGPARLAPGWLDADAVGAAIGARFVEWSRDPLTPSTAPGGTCLEGAYMFANRGDWRTSGVAKSDGCGAVMRIVPLALALDGEELIRAAEISSAVTHAHPNAIAAAVAGAWLCRRVLEEGALTRGQVEETVALVRARYPRSVDVAPALEAALVEADRADSPWLLEGAIPAGDGGWRAPSALGLAVAAALRWGCDPSDRAAAFAIAVEKAARIDGDSDSVACLVGMLLGAAFGEEALPPAWVAVVPEADTIRSLAEALVELDLARRKSALLPVPQRPSGVLPAPRPVPPGARTSVTDPLFVSWVITPVVPGAAASARRRGDPVGGLGITFLPGKKASSMFGAPWHRDLRADLARLAEARVTLLISLVEDSELLRFEAAELVPMAGRLGIRVQRVPIVDGGVPGDDVIQALVSEAVGELHTGRNVVVHCRGGLGRAGTVVGCILRRLRRAPEEALAEVRAFRPGAVENAAQEGYVRGFGGAQG